MVRIAGSVQRGKNVNFIRKLFDKTARSTKDPDPSQPSGAPSQQTGSDFDGIRPEKVEAIVAIVPKGAPEPTLEGGRKSYVWHVFQAENPEMYRAISAINATRPGAVVAIYYESECMDLDGRMKSDPFLDFRKHTSIPKEHSFYVQALDVPNGPGGPRMLSLITVVVTPTPACIVCSGPLVPARAST